MTERTKALLIGEFAHDRGFGWTKDELDAVAHGRLSDHHLTIVSMAQVRNKPKGVDRTVLVDHETRKFNDRRWAQWDREDQKAAATPHPGFFRRLFG